MIKYLENLILDNWKNWESNKKPDKLDFLKINAGTAIRNKKVGFFVFNNNKPVFFIKTVRKIEYNKTIEESFKKSKNIYKSLKNNSVPKPIYLGSHQDIVFYLETVALGKQFHSCKTKKDLDKFLNWFLNFQEIMIEKDKKIKLINYINNLVDSFLNLYKLDKELKELIKEINNNLKEKIDNLNIVSIFQHGDLTSDNVLSDKGEIKVIDWDNFKNINLPLFDLLVFLQRWSKIRDISFIDKYSDVIENYLNRFEINKQALKSLIFAYYLLDFTRKKKKLTDYDKNYLRLRLKEIKKINFKT